MTMMKMMSELDTWEPNFACLIWVWALVDVRWAIPSIFPFNSTPKDKSNPTKFEAYKVYKNVK